MITKELIKELRKGKRSYIRTGYKGFTIETYSDYKTQDCNIFHFNQDDINQNYFMDITCPKALSYLLKPEDAIKLVIYNDSYGKESSIYLAGFNYRMIFFRIIRKGEFFCDTLIHTEVDKVKNNGQ